MMNDRISGCDQIPLELLVIGDRPSPGAERALDHVQDCLRCQRRLQVMLALQSTLDRRLGQARPSSGSPRQVLRIAAIFVFLLFASSLVYIARSPAGDLSRLASHVPHPIFPLRVRAPEAGSLQAGLQAYSQGRYQIAVELLEPLSSNVDARFCLGVSLYLSGQFERSIQVLSTFSEQGSAWRYEALWYRAQAHLELQQSQAALAVLLLIPPENRYYSASRRLLRELERRLP